MFRRKLIYIQVHPGHFLARVAGEPKSIRKECAGLTHPRTLARDFSSIEAAMKDILNEFQTFQSRILKPHVLVHLIPTFEGGYTQIELRAFREAAVAAGATFPWLLDNKYGPLREDQLSEISAGLKTNLFS